MKNNNLFPVRFRKALRESHLTIDSIYTASKYNADVNLTKVDIRKMRDGKIYPDNITMMYLASVLKVNPRWLMGYESAQEKY